MSNGKIEVNKEVLKEIFSAANMKMPENVTEESVKRALGKIKSQDSGYDKNMDDLYADDLEQDNGEASKNILVVDDIGVVTYQLKIMLQKLGYNVQIAKDVFSALKIFVRSKYAFMVMDLFVSTEQEGYTLLNETKKIITKNRLKTKIIVMTASHKSENKIKCINGGADVFLKKDVGWQDKLIELIENYEEAKDKI